MDVLIQYIVNEWNTIIAAPLILGAVLLVSLVAGYLGARWRYERLIGIKDEKYAQLKDANTKLGNSEPTDIDVVLKPEYQAYDSSNSRDFYNNIAIGYDQRNSPELVETHREIIRIIGNHLQNKTNFKVLDLGGGTGKLIAHHFFDSKVITWIYVDSSPAMVEQFAKNLRNTNLNLDIKVKDIRDINGLYPAKTCDVILLSLLLTSMQDMPNFQELSTLLKDDGIFIIADIDPVYTIQHPYYVVTVENRPHALRTNPVNLSELNKNMISCGLKQTAVKTIQEGSINYSFVYVFNR